MSHVRTDSLRVAATSEVASGCAAGGAEPVALRQLRHQTKNALQRIIGELARTPLRSTPVGAALADELERRVCLSARISDALFGFVTRPRPLAARLLELAQATVELLSAAEQTIRVTVTVAGVCRPGRDTIVVQVAHEMIGNAIKHGMHVRLLGHIAIQVRSDDGGRTVLTVSDDGWGLGIEQGGEGMPIMRALAAADGGTIALSRHGGWTQARLDLPGLA